MKMCGVGSDADSFAAHQFQRPLDFIRSEHDRQLLIYDRMVEYAEGTKLAPVIEDAETLVAFLTEDLRLHYQDEEENLFPILRCRCPPEDSVYAVLAELDRQHSLDRFLAMHLVIDLKVIAHWRKEKGDETIRVFFDLLTFVKAQRRSLVWENEVVLPAARERLSLEDLEQMGNSMAARRGIACPG